MPKATTSKPSADKSECGEAQPAGLWFLYMLRRSDGALYTGITTDVARRFAQHSSGKGARALRGKSLAGVVYAQAVGDRSLASRVEYAVKRLTKAEKEALVATAPGCERLLALLGIQAEGSSAEI